jgi:hypothetical protein
MAVGALDTANAASSALANAVAVCEAEIEVEVETGLEAAEADGDARGRRWRMPNTGGTMRPEHRYEMGCCAIVAMVVIPFLMFQAK